MLCFPNAKINIGLHVIQKRPDGYHNIETVFCPIGLSDILEFVPVPDEPSGNLTFTATGLTVEGDPEKNLCIKAYRLLSRDFDLPAIDLHLHKVIPMGAGLGGGSSDAAFMLKYLNLQFNLKLGEDRLCAYASMLGSDCAFFIRNKPVLGYERGNRFREIPVSFRAVEIALVHPGIHVSTAEAYSGVQPRPPAQPLEKMMSLPMEQWPQHLFNDFEYSIIQRFPTIGEIKSKLYRLGAVYASMSGSGSSVYGLFRGKAPSLQDHFPGHFCWKGPAL